MENKRTLTIGVTINLGNYENLHLEATGPADDLREAAELRRYLADVLDGFAQNNATAKDAIDKYKDRILSDTTENTENTFIAYTPAESGENTDDPETSAESLPVPDLSMMFGADTSSESEEKTAAEPEEDTEPEPASPEPAPVYIPVPPAVPEPKTPEPEQKPEIKPPAPETTPGEYTCERCGEPVSKVQRDVSKMFTGKTLCKKCFNGTR